MIVIFNEVSCVKYTKSADLSTYHMRIVGTTGGCYSVVGNRNMMKVRQTA